MNNKYTPLLGDECIYLEPRRRKQKAGPNMRRRWVKYVLEHRVTVVQAPGKFKIVVKVRLGSGAVISVSSCKLQAAQGAS